MVLDVVRQKSGFVVVVKIKFEIENKARVIGVDKQYFMVNNLWRANERLEFLARRNNSLVNKWKTYLQIHRIHSLVASLSPCQIPVWYNNESTVFNKSKKIWQGQIT